MAETILSAIADFARQRVAADTARTSPDAMRELALRESAGGAAFEAALRRPGMRFICEVKKASPSKGLISPDFPYLDIARYLELCSRLGLAALVEAHDEAEIASAVSAGARIIGVNNRNLKDFSVDFSNAARLRDLIPPEAVFVAESGVKGPADAAALKQIGADAALIGEALMRSADKGAMLNALREAAR